MASFMARILSTVFILIIILYIREDRQREQERNFDLDYDTLAHVTYTKYFLYLAIYRANGSPPLSIQLLLRRLNRF